MITLLNVVGIIVVYSILYAVVHTFAVHIVASYRLHKNMPRFFNEDEWTLVSTECLQHSSEDVFKFSSRFPTLYPSWYDSLSNPEQHIISNTVNRIRQSKLKARNLTQIKDLYEKYSQ